MRVLLKLYLSPSSPPPVTFYQYLVLVVVGSFQMGVLIGVEGEIVVILFGAGGIPLSRSQTLLVERLFSSVI